jgi:hypothetical protein
VPDIVGMSGVGWLVRGVALVVVRGVT